MIGTNKLASGLLLAIVARAAICADFPSRPVTMVVPYPPGGVVDIVGRLIADKLGASLGMRVVVDNRAGAAGTIGAA